MKSMTAVVIGCVLLLCGCSYGMNEQDGSLAPESDAQGGASSAVLSDDSDTASAPGQQENSSASSALELTDSPPSDKNDWRLILVNRQSPLPADFDVELEETIGTYRFDERAADDLRAFMDAAKKDGVSLTVISTYRKQSTQERLYAAKIAEYVNAGYSDADAKNEAARWVAVPGTSEHQSGLAFDVVSSDWYTYNDDLYETFEQTKECEWLFANCVEYGFVLRYPKNKQEITGITYEPWHFRYVGVENARYMTENNLCLEEYTELLGG